jgi:VanZ family protein
MILMSLKRIRIAIILLAVYWIAIFIATHIPVKSMPKIDNFDKYVHTFAYAVLAFLLVWALSSNRLNWIPFAVTAVVVAVYGVFDEISQAYVGRSADIVDWYFDCLGTVIGLAAFAMVGTFWTLIRQRIEPVSHDSDTARL